MPRKIVWGFYHHHSNFPLQTVASYLDLIIHHFVQTCSKLIEQKLSIFTWRPHLIAPRKVYHDFFRLWKKYNPKPDCISSKDWKKNYDKNYDNIFDKWPFFFLIFLWVFYFQIWQTFNVAFMSRKCQNFLVRLCIKYLLRD